MQFLATFWKPGILVIHVTAIIYEFNFCVSKGLRVDLGNIDVNLEEMDLSEKIKGLGGVGVCALEKNENAIHY